MTKTTVYFVRHAKPDLRHHDDMSRELSAQGLEDRRLVTKFLADKNVDVVVSSPYKRAVDTVKDFAIKQQLEIHIIDDFRERKVDSGWIDDFQSFCKAQWTDFNYKRSDGESLAEVQKRNIEALSQILDQYAGKTIVVGSHGTALSTVINYYDAAFGYAEFEKIKSLMPWIVRMVFEGKNCIEISSFRLIA